MEYAKKIILATRNTLNDVDIRGIENMKKILGCYNALGSVLENIESYSEKKANEQKEDDENG